MDIAKKLKTTRQKLGLSQREAAAHWRISIKTLQAWEQGARKPRGLALERLLQLLASKS